MQDILVLCSEDSRAVTSTDSAQGQSQSKEAGNNGINDDEGEGKEKVKQNDAEVDGGESRQCGAPDVATASATAAVPQHRRVLVTAIEAAVYTIPSSSSLILYIAKVDTTGQGLRPSPTSRLVRALIRYFVDPTREGGLSGLQRVWVHVFARAQGQYLFPNSTDYAGKKPLADVRLCSWWKRVLEDVSQETVGCKDGSENESGVAGDKERLGMWYILPGMSELEAKQTLGELSTMSTASTLQKRWVYGHPYAQTDVPLPYVPNRINGGGEIRYNLGHLIPSFDDDPKSRFMDEIACTAQVIELPPSPKKRKVRANSAAGSKEEEEKKEKEKDKDKEKEKSKDKEERIPGELAKVTPDEFWERMSFRQECIAGAVTGFFVVAFSWPVVDDGTSRSVSQPQPQPGQVSHHLIRRIVTTLQTGHDFGTPERAQRSTELLEGAIKGLCQDLPSAPPSISTDPASGILSTSAILARAGSSMHGTALRFPPAFSPRPRRVTATEAGAESVESGRKTPEPKVDPPYASTALMRSPRTPPRRFALLPPNVERKDGEEETPAAPASASAEADLDEYTYRGYVYGAADVANSEAAAASTACAAGASGASGGAGGAVRELAVRRKAKRR